MYTIEQNNNKINIATGHIISVNKNTDESGNSTFWVFMDDNSKYKISETDYNALIKLI